MQDTFSENHTVKLLQYRVVWKSEGRTDGHLNEQVKTELCYLALQRKYLTTMQNK